MKFFVYILNALLKYLLCVQLVFLPAYSFATPTTPVPGQSTGGQSTGQLTGSQPTGQAEGRTSAIFNGFTSDFFQKQVQKTKDFNNKVESLNGHIFGPRVPGEYYTDHPLDFFSLIHQQVEMDRSNFFESIYPFHKETKAIYEGTKKGVKNGLKTLGHAINPLAKKQAKKQAQSQAQTQSTAQATEPTTAQATTQGTTQATEPAGTEQKSALGPAKPFLTNIKRENLMVDVFPATLPHHQPQEQIPIVRINMQGDKANFLLKKHPAINTYSGKSAILPRHAKYVFEISYQGQPLHRFSNNVLWISFFGPYLIFMEPSRIYEKQTSSSPARAELSFIDLSYFHSAIGKTALPVFHVPVALNSKAKRALLEYPVSIQSEEDRLTLKGAGSAKYSISKAELDQLSRQQQIHFNVLVSMLSTQRYERDILPFLEEIAHSFGKVLDRQKKQENHSRDFTQSQHIQQQVLVELLKNRANLGSPDHHAGHYGQVKASQARLSQGLHKQEKIQQALNEAKSIPPGERTPETEQLLTTLREKLAHIDISELDKQTYLKSVQNLETDQAFQQVIKQVAEAKFETRTLTSRLKGLWFYLTLPQPLGAPKIQKALGLMANALGPDFNISDRGRSFVEGVKQLIANRKIRFVGVPVLAGMAYMASQEVANFIAGSFQFAERGFTLYGTLLTDIANTYLPSMINPVQWSNPYLQE